MSDNTLHNPFPGLRSYSPLESDNFYGRDEQIVELARKIKRNRLITVLGASGSGKSSLIRAGLLPQLDASLASKALRNCWETTEMTPGGAPLERLAQAVFALHQSLEQRKFPEAEPAELAAASSEYTLMAEALLSRSSFGLVELVKQLKSDNPVLILVDQFEELFRITNHNSKRNYALAFIKLLLEAVKQSEVPIYIVITMRSDYLGDCTKYEGLPEAINRSQYLIPRMNRQQRRDIILGPLQKQGVAISARLVNRLLNDMGDEPDQLPIIQHALMRMWFDWSKTNQLNEPIDLDHYEAIGTLTDALNEHAESVFLPLSSAQKILAEKIFKCLSESTQDGRVVRRPAAVNELEAICETDTNTLSQTLSIFRSPHCSFLTPNIGETITDNTIIDVSHESLFRLWQRVIGWIKAETQSSEQYLRLSEMACRYQNDEASLLRDPELSLALEWQENNKPNAAWAARYNNHFEQTKGYIEKSVQQDIADKQAQDKQRLKDIATANKILLLKKGLVLACLAGAMVLGVFSWLNYVQHLKTESLKLAMDADNALLSSPEKAAYTALLALRKSETDEARQALNQAYTEMRHRSVYSIDWQNLTTGPKPSSATTHKTCLAENSTATPEDHFILTKVLASKQIRGRTLISVTALGTIMVANTNQPYCLPVHQQFNLFEKKSSSPPQLTATATDIHYNPAEDRVSIAIATLDGDLHLVHYSQSEKNFERAEPLVTAEGKNTQISVLAFSPAGNRLATGNQQGEVTLFSTAGGSEPALTLPTIHARALSALAFGESGEYIASGDWDGAVHLHRLQPKPERLQTSAHHDSKISSLYVFEGPIPELVSGDRNGTLRYWRWQSPMPKLLDVGQCSYAEVVGLVSLENRHLLCATQDGVLKIYRLGDNRIRARNIVGNNTSGYINSVSGFSRQSEDGTIQESVLVSGNDTIVLWGLPHTPNKHTEGASQQAYSRLEITDIDKRQHTKQNLWLASVANSHRVELYKIKVKPRNGDYSYNFNKQPTFVINTPADFIVQAVSFDQVISPTNAIVTSIDGKTIEYVLNDTTIIQNTYERLKQLQRSNTCRAIFGIKHNERCLPEL